MLHPCGHLQDLGHRRDAACYCRIYRAVLSRSSAFEPAGGLGETGDLFVAQLRPLLPAAYRLAYGMLHGSHEAEDAVQEAILNAWRARGRLRHDYVAYTNQGDALHSAEWEPMDRFGPGSQDGPFASHGTVHVPTAALERLYAWVRLGATVEVRS